MSTPAPAPTPAPIDAGALTRALALRDLSDPAAGPHAVQLVVDRLEHALAKLWRVPVRRYHGPRVVTATDNYDHLGYRADAVTRGRRYTRYLDETRMLRSHTSAHLPALLRDVAAGGPGEVLLSVPGVCYRRDVIDRHHVGEPHQLDLWLVRRCRPALTGADLVEMIAAVVGSVLPGRPWRTPHSPHPYTVAGREIRVEMGTGEMGTGDMEIGECGLASPDVLRRAGLGSDASGLAMGLGLDRLVMLVKGLTDIRLLRASDPRIAAQMCDLRPYRAVSSMPAIRRDLSVALADPDPEVLGDRIRTVLGAGAGAVEAVDIMAVTPYARLPEAARRRMGMRPGQHNVLVRLVLRDHDRSLTDVEANGVRDLVYRGLHEGAAGEWAATNAGTTGRRLG